MIIGSELKLEVPLLTEIRNNIRKEVEAWFVQNQVIPPVSYDAIASTADHLIDKNGWDKNYKAFVMVCCGNAVWRPVIGSVPFNRRILLLPHCLKNSVLCKGQQDEMGLLCSECGNCSISGLLREAENLGYVALVTEGTTVTARLIESGKVDAVIGIGCMEVLQKMFISVSRFAIPSIGIPLLSCGCTDTTADSEWIKEEMYHFEKDSNVRLLNLNYLRKRTSSIFGKEQLQRILDSSENSTEQLVFDSLLAGGKRLRPLLTVLAYEAFNGHTKGEHLNRLALSVECFHKASLIHDDIEDDDDLRYGKETLHALHGIPVAINIGDLLIGEGYRLITETNLPAEIILNCIKMVSHGHRRLSIGQGIELMSLKNRKILSLEETLQVFDYKTATAFKVSLLLGAIAAGAEDNSLNLLEKFSRSIGIAYQIKDDIEDFKNEEGEFEIYKPSVLISLLQEKLTGTVLGDFHDAYRNNNIKTIRVIAEGSNMSSEAEELLSEYINESRECLAGFQNAGLKMALHEILGNIFKEYI
jgi:geranylgeranyl diphosphate synthase, type II